ncbi:hypothetical protein CDAR_287011 [Caerostris darwini]|uniref:Uncharacterized protein n=1 Tax=Caerostris darwini TaxID=1538125 RepID=A0AAV4RDB1_9ARAC|nr:hypothetical protein CDAR_287011 [Caerostris darwini]
MQKDDLKKRSAKNSNKKKGSFQINGEKKKVHCLGGVRKREKTLSRFANQANKRPPPPDMQGKEKICVMFD